MSNYSLGLIIAATKRLRDGLARWKEDCKGRRAMKYLYKRKAMQLRCCLIVTENLR